VLSPGFGVSKRERESGRRVGPETRLEPLFVFLHTRRRVGVRLVVVTRRVLYKNSLVNNNKNKKQKQKKYPGARALGMVK
jgi:hypothetical protein